MTSSTKGPPIPWRPPILLLSPCISQSASYQPVSLNQPCVSHNLLVKASLYLCKGWSMSLSLVPVSRKSLRLADQNYQPWIVFGDLFIHRQSLLLENIQLSGNHSINLTTTVTVKTKDWLQSKNLDCSLFQKSHNYFSMLNKLNTIQVLIKL